ncbi:zinc ABC transporter substrate-binding protein [Pilimelia terevasa]|uniref:Zinc ABC transporter substrate-binding protein n=1 Tax=Pilimelia terevasa TaxID=53372 RepID=A0A8J3FLB5_9ACTN|nr:metal ABC transporter substrate-binding protein [Pilimelia terevasa]GGK40499.1 zinc ABC transporter substrate-binding protein [Pilimelia terevasa]
MWYRPPHVPRRAPALALLAATLLAATGCADRPADDGDPGKITAVAGFYPMHYLAARVGGPSVAVTSLARPGVEPHDMELTPAQLETVRDAELVVYLRGVQPAVDAAVGDSGDRLFDVATHVPLDAPAEPAGHDGEAEPDGHDEGTTDPHVWLDPQRYATAAEKLAARLGTLDPPRAAGYTANAAALRTELTELDAAYRTGLATCTRRQIVTSHAAFGYLARRYQLTQVPITGISPDQEPAPRRMTEIAALARQYGATTIFFETLVSPKIAETVARQAGAGTAVLDPIEGVSGADDYPAVMRRNLATLRQALGCR